MALTQVCGAVVNISRRCEWGRHKRILGWMSNGCRLTECDTNGHVLCLHALRQRDKSPLAHTGGTWLADRETRRGGKESGVYATWLCQFPRVEGKEEEEWRTNQNGDLPTRWVHRNGTKRKCLQGGLIVSTTKEDERHWDYALCDKTYSDVVAAVSLLLLEANQLDSFYTISSFSFTFANAEARNEIQRECGPAADVPSKPTAPPPPPRENADTIDRNDSRFHIELIG